MTFSKEFDLLKKFVALANNNPNEHEANVAARRVCKLLEKHDFAFVQHVQQTTHNSRPSQTSYTPPSYQRPPNTPPPAYERPKGSYYDYTIFDEFFKTAGYDAGKTKWYYNREPKEAKIHTEPGWPGENPFKKPSEQQHEERLLKCRICGNSKLTKFVGVAELYECNNCQWTAYEKSKKAK